MNIWDNLPKPFFVLAPMEAVTDHVFRRVVNHAAPADLYFSEFTNATGWVHAGEKAVAGRLTIHKDEDYPLIAQIWCAEPEDIASLARHCKELGYMGIDLNMGCPVKTAVKNSGGSAMIRQPDLAAEMIAAAKTAGLPVSVKTRLGYSTVGEWRGWLGHLLKQDIAALTIHLRTKKEMSKVPAHWELAPEIVALRDELAPETLVIGNGDIRDRQHGLQLIDETGMNGMMIGRGIFTNVFDFEDTPQEHSQRELLGLLSMHLSLFEAAKTTRPYQTLKRFFKIYVRDWSGAHELRNQLMETSSLDEARALIDAHMP
ncbi:tRNA-dihydrouridine synthase [Candidatus Saccharibacteria bacterium]|nr:tRNA-dihydrouridine synthase [Candidatus Saccharibacteria bacterium]